MPTMEMADDSPRNPPREMQVRPDNFGPPPGQTRRNSEGPPPNSPSGLRNSGNPPEDKLPGEGEGPNVINPQACYNDLSLLALAMNDRFVTATEMPWHARKLAYKTEFSVDYFSDEIQATTDAGGRKMESRTTLQRDDETIKVVTVAPSMGLKMIATAPLSKDNQLIFSSVTQDDQGRIWNKEIDTAYFDKDCNLKLKAKSLTYGRPEDAPAWTTIANGQFKGHDQGIGKSGTATAPFFRVFYGRLSGTIVGKRNF